MNLQKKNLIPSILLFLTLVSLPVLSQAAEFDAMVVPSLMDSDMDGWYKIPPNSGPNIHRAASVYQGQMFNLFIFFRDKGDATLFVRHLRPLKKCQD